MARVTLQLPDDLYEAYQERAKARNKRVDYLISAEIQAVFPLDLARDRVIIIDPKNRQRIETLIGEGHITDATDLADRFERLLSIKVGGVSIDFTPAQQHELAELAARGGHRPEDLIRSTVQSMEELFFSHAYEVMARAPNEPSMAAPEAKVVHAGDLKPGDPESALVQTNAQVPDDSSSSAPNVLQRFLGNIRGKEA